MHADAPLSSEYEARLALQPLRPLHPWERVLLTELCRTAALPSSLTEPQALEAYRVRQMLDDGMGSIRFVTTAGNRRCKSFGIAELWYIDSDSIPVSFALNLDEQGAPWEIDAWKIDFSPLRQPPTQTDLRVRPDGAL